ncbi:MAG TPA: DUF4139 domain-containing protein [Alphaproteobacteria bacterium]|nr:DUF4139 domain-containing protein [Alphaproteobacteria bacterium]
MQKRKLSALAAATIGLGTIGLAMAGATNAAAETTPQGEQKVTLKDQSEVAVTIYNRDLALIKERRKVTLKAGRNRLAFIDVSGRMRPETAILRAATAGRIALTEQNFNFDIMTRQKLLEKSVGQTVRIVKVHPTTGAETIVEAKVLSALKGVVLQIGDRIETGIPGRIVFDRIPPNLRDRPTLVIDLESKTAGAETLELSYLSRGLTWRADYVGELNAADDKLTLNGWVTLINRSGTTYRNAKLQLVAGDVNVVRNQLSRGHRAKGSARSSGASSISRERFFDYHLYGLDRPTTIAQNQIKQVALMSAPGVAVKKEYELQAGGSYYYRRQYAGVVKRPVNVFLAFKNDKASNLGLPMPRGVVRIYKRNAAGKALFVGEDRMDHTPEGNDVRLRMGKAFDVTAERRQVDYDPTVYDRRTFESEHEITLKNARPKAVTVIVRETISGKWEMLRKTHDFTKVAANLAEWRIQVPGKGRTVLRYRVRVRY